MLIKRPFLFVCLGLIMRIKASLKSGLLLKLLQDMNNSKHNNNAFADIDDKKPVLLQIRGIIPVLEEGDLWPNRGFYLRVSDSSHASYVSLPNHHDEMILSNKLKLGQYIYIQMLEKSEPVPLLRGITPVPGRRKCEGSPQDIISTSKFLELIKFSEHDLIVDKAVISEEVIANSSNTRILPLEERSHRQLRSSRPSKVRPSERRRSFDIKRKATHDSDSDNSTLTSVSSTVLSKRRSWNESDIHEVKEITNSSVVKHEVKPLPRSANLFSIRGARYESSDDNSSCSTNRKMNGAPRKFFKSTTNRKIPLTKVNVEKISSSTCLDGENKGAETGIVWGSLKPNLLKLGKEIIKQRDLALLGAADALQEACAADRLLNCLSTFSDFNLTEGDDLQPYVDKFFDLQDNLAQSRLITESLTNIIPPTDSETYSGGSCPVKDALKIAVERKKNAITWIRSAMAVDLSPCSSSLNPVNCTGGGTLQTAKRSVIPSCYTKPKGPCIMKSQIQSEDSLLISTSDKDEQSGWTRGSTLASSTDLGTSLQDECRNLFLGYVEKYLDEVERKSFSDGEIAGMLIKIKRISDWLDNIVNKESKSSCNNGYEGSYNSYDPRMEACRRVRNKICDILLNNVERTAMALENT